MFKLTTIGVALLFVLPISASAQTVADLQTQINALLAQLSAAQGAPVSVVCPNLARTLVRGSRGADVTALQTFLIARGHMSGTATGYFGVLTEAGVQRFQAEQSVVTSGSARTTGYGSVGTKTRAAIARACAPSTPQAPVAPIPLPPPTIPAPTCSMSASKATIVPFETVTISWTSQNADTASDEGGKADVNGSNVYSNIDKTTTFNTAFTGKGGQTTCSMTVQVSAPLNTPVINYILPSGGPGGTVITINGSNFASMNTILFNGTVPNVPSTDGKVIRFTVPLNTPIGTYSLTVINSADTVNGKRSNATNFMVTNPDITEVSPTVVTYGTTVTLTGNGFNDSTKAYLGGINGYPVVPTSVSTDGKTLIFVMPSGISAGSKTVGVSNDGATINNLLYITVNPY
ncbi:MAG TPA: IPT/TIG domain-containing protein [Candidatus Paceibacterota bacterium]